MRLAPLTPLLLVAIAGCASRPDIQARPSHLLDSAMLDRILREHPVESDASSRCDRVMDSDDFSIHLLQVRTELPRRLHVHHDLTLFVHRGGGQLTLEPQRTNKTLPLRSGNLFHIPRGTPYACVNTDKSQQPLVLLLLYTPPLDEADTIEVAEENTSYERPAGRE